MKKTLDIAIGKKLPLDILMQPVALLAQRGWGKTVTAKGCYEAAHDAGAQCITIFPTGKWWSLRLAADGKGPGLTDVFVIGGPHGDVPLTPSSGKVIAKLLVERRIHAVIDVSLLRKSERHRFLADLFEEFWLLKKLENENYPVVLFIEEAHAIAPQMLRQGQIDEARMLGAVEDLAAEGRNHGIGIVLLDQRSARVNKNIIALVEVLILGRIGYPTDRKIIGDWVVDKGAEDLEWLKELPRLKPGEAYVYAPVLEIFERLPLRMARTFNATATAKIGERTVKTGALTQVDVSALKEQMAQVIADAEKDDPKALKREVARLTAELAKKPAAAPASKPLEVPVSIKEELTLLQRSIETIAKIGDQLAQKQQVVVAALDNARTLLKPTFERPMQKLEAKPPGVVGKPWQPPPGTAKVKMTVLKAEGISAKATEILSEMVALHPRQLSRDEIAVRAGLRNNGNFRNYMSELRTTCTICGNQGSECTCASGPAGLLEEKRDVPTEAGIRLVAGAKPKTFEELRAQWGGLLSAKAIAMLDTIIAAGDRPVSRDDLAAAVGLENNGNFRNYVSELNTAGVIDEKRGVGIVASPALFLGEG
jgi:hypothetical protein